MLKCFGHMNRVSESRLTKEIYRADVEGNIRRERLRRTFSDQMENVLKKTGVTYIYITF